MTERADVLVVGIGGCGASALHHLASRGISAIGIDRFPPGHDRGSSHGDTRIIRQAYFEHPDYVPLLQRAYAAWRALEDETSSALFEQCGLVLTGPPDGEMVRGARLAAELYDVALESVAPDDAAAEFPWLRVPPGHEIRWEAAGGYLRVEDCVRAHADRAVELGAVLRTGAQVVSWHADERGVRVETDRRSYEGDRLVLCPGAWAPSLLPDVAAAAGMHVLRKVLVWAPRRGDDPAPHTTFFVEAPHGAFYGFPAVDGATVKLAEHSGGAAIDDPLSLDRALHRADLDPVARFVTEALPGLEPAAARHAVCMYTMTSDAHFVVDRHPRHANVALAAGFSGHGFKFMSALGPIVADLAVDGRTDAPIGFLGLDRFEASGG